MTKTVNNKQKMSVYMTHLYYVYTANEGTYERSVHVSKGCDTSKGCQYRSYVVNEICDRQAARDWACVECCYGDLCNYFVTVCVA